MNRPAPSIMTGIDRRPIRIGAATVDPVSRDATWPGGEERLQPLTLKVLLALWSRRGEVVTRDELIQLCWDGRIVGDDVINRSISLLRHFAERAGGFEIQTVPRAGYRLIETAARTRKRRQLGIAAAIGALALVGIGAATVQHYRNSAPRMLAVMPFTASSGDYADLADGLSDELISDLAHNDRLRVIGRSSAWQYKDKAVDPRVIGRQLGVDYLVEGDIANGGDGMRITASLVRTSDGATMWSQVYTASKNQTPEIGAAVGGGVSNALGVPEGPALVGYRPNSDAYALYLKGRSLFRQRTNPSLEEARSFMLRAISIDPKFAAPWAYAGGITFLLNQKSFKLEGAAPNAPLITPRQALVHALELDPNFADAHGFLGWIYQPYTVEAAGHLQRAVQLSPNDPQILFWWTLGQLRQGNFAEYANVAYRGAALDPLWPRIVTEAASAELWSGDKAAMQRYVDRIRAGNPDGAREVEAVLAGQEADLAKIVEIGLADKTRPFQQSTANAATALVALGFEREGRAIGQFGPNDILYNSDTIPDRAALLKLQADDPGTFDYLQALGQLEAHRRYADIVALYDADLGDLREIRRATFANREARSDLGGIVAEALMKVGRRQEAEQLLRLTDDADHVTLGYGKVAPYMLVTIAGNDAIAGRREEAIHLLQQVTAEGGYISLASPQTVGPMWDNLRGDPRFEKIANLSLAHLREQRQKVLAMHLF
ncbi:MAG: winged helix-turn-helix domain-containing protein [Sphingomicrobium sp.]